MFEASSKKNNSVKNSSKDRPKDALNKKRRSLNRLIPERAYRLADPKIRMWTLLVGVSLLTAFLLAPRSFQVYSLTIGEPAPETILSPITFQVIDEEATNKNQQEVQYDYSCDCPAYKFRQGYCKHIKEVQKDHCRWEAIHDGGEPVENEDSELRCPKCGAEVTAMKYGV